MTKNTFFFDRLYYLELYIQLCTVKGNGIHFIHTIYTVMNTKATMTVSIITFLPAQVHIPPFLCTYNFEKKFFIPFVFLSYFLTLPRARDPHYTHTQKKKTRDHVPSNY